MAGLMLVWTLVGNRFTELQWIAVLVATIAGIDLGLWFFDPDLDWYVGLSGVLHGILIAGAFVGMRRGSVEAAALGVLVVGKIIWEQLSGPLPGSASLAGGSVVVNAHLYGAIAGALTAALLIRVLFRPSI
jgi:rhomboid family GlyGly-CTERM serine protease